MNNEQRRLTILVLICLLVYLIADGIRPRLAANIEWFDPRREGGKRATG